MGVSEYYARGRGLAAERPGAVVAAAVLIVLGADLVAGVLQGRYTTTAIVRYAWEGIRVGLIVGLAGVGLSMTYSILNFANFSHGDLMTSGAFFGWAVAFLVAGFGRFDAGGLLLLGAGANINIVELGISVATEPLALAAGAVVAAVGTAVLSVAVDRVVYRPMREESGISLLIASVGVALVLRYLLLFVFLGGNRPLTYSQVTPSYGVSVGGGAIPVTAHQAVLVVAAVGLMLGVHLLVQRTKLGTAMRAMADNEDLALVSGIPTERVVLWTWLVGGSLAGFAGYLYALERGTLSTTLGWGLLLLIFAAVILGGIGSIYGAMVGGLLIGLVSSLSLLWVPSSFSTAIAFVAMIFVLLFSPRGIFRGVSTA